MLSNQDLLPVKEKYQQYLGHQLAELQEIVQPKTMRRLQAYEAYTMQQYGLGALDTLFLLHWHSKGIRELAGITQVSAQTLTRIFDRLNLPQVSIKEAISRTFTFEQRRENGKKAYQAGLANLSPEQLREIAKKGAQAAFTSVTLEYWKENGRKAGRASVASLTPKQLRERSRRMHEALTPEERIEHARKAALSLPPEQRSENALNRRLAANLKPNRLENQMIAILKELGIYAETALFAAAGSVYHSDLLENRRHVRFSDGKTIIPDFKVKGEKKVIELYGDYWHSREFCEQWGKPDYKWNSALLIEEYAAVGYQCLVYWESELIDPARREEIKQDIISMLKVRGTQSELLSF